MSDKSDMAGSMKIVYTILNRLDKSLDKESVDSSEIDNNALHITENRWKHYIKMLSNAGYIDGVKIKEFIDGSEDYNIDDIEITLTGLQYLAENTMMIKIGQAFGRFVSISSAAASIIK